MIKRNPKRGHVIESPDDMADLIRRVRRSTRLSQEELGRAMGSGRQPTVSSWETGRNSPSIRGLINMAQALGMQLYIEFLEEEDQ